MMQEVGPVGCAVVLGTLSIAVGGQYWIMFEHCRLFQFKFPWWAFLPLGFYVFLYVFLYTECAREWSLEEEPSELKQRFESSRDGFGQWPKDVVDRFSKNKSVVVPTKEMRECLALCVKWYKSNPCGGIMHVVLDDDNVENHHIDWTIERYCLSADNEVILPEAYEICTMLKSFNVMQRKWITYNIYPVMDGEGEREVDVEEDEQTED